MSDLEKTNLEAHVDLCAERYKRLEEKFENLDLNMNSLRKDHENLTLKMSSNHNEVNFLIFLDAFETIRNFFKNKII